MTLVIYWVVESRYKSFVSSRENSFFYSRLSWGMLLRGDFSFEEIYQFFTLSQNHVFIIFIIWLYDLMSY